jgi:formamidopyrimidine-DNA glycosylase
MPELPEVETIRRGLENSVLGLEICKVEVLFPGIVKSGLNLLPRLRRRRITALERTGKHLIISFEGDLCLVIHLGMSGKILLLPRSSPPPKHTHLVIHFRGYPRKLCLNDPRRFGYVHLTTSGGLRELACLRRLGPDATRLTKAEFVRMVKSKRPMIKPLLLDQGFMAGLGNIYSDESLHRAGIHPRRRSHTLHPSRLAALHRAIRTTLRNAIKAGGSTLNDETYLNVDGELGRFQLQLRAYGREGKRCRRCGRSIKRITVGSRSTYLCPRCQR